MKHLSLTNNRINNMEDAQLLIDAVSSHPSIDDIDLEDCFGDNINGYDVLQSIIAGGVSFTTINFNSNNICTGGGTTILDFIMRNPPLKRLYLENNNLNDEDAVLIARALKHNTNLKEFRLRENNIKDVGFSALRKAVNDTTSLNTVSDSNHTCFFDGVDFRDIPRIHTAARCSLAVQ